VSVADADDAVSWGPACARVSAGRAYVG